MTTNLAILRSMLDSAPKYGGKRIGELMEGRFRVRNLFASESGSVVTILTNGSETMDITVFPEQATTLVITLGFWGSPECETLDGKS